MADLPNDINPSARTFDTARAPQSDGLDEVSWKRNPYDSLVAHRETVRFAETIPGLIWHGAGRAPHSAIISIHGGGGTKEDFLPEEIDFVTSQGVTLVSIDAHLHGERKPADFELAGPDGIDPQVFLEILAKTARDVITVVGELQRDPSVDGDRIGLRGGSMGGYIALAATGLGARVAAILSICGGADYIGMYVEQMTLMSAEAREWADTIVNSTLLESLTRAIDPLYHAENFAPKPILMIHGRFDPLVPICGQRALYEKLAPHYREQPDDCLFLTHSGGHTTPQQLVDFGWAWLVQALMRAPNY